MNEQAVIQQETITKLPFVEAVKQYGIFGGETKLKKLGITQKQIDEQMRDKNRWCYFGLPSEKRSLEDIAQGRIRRLTHDIDVLDYISTQRELDSEKKQELKTLEAEREKTNTLFSQYKNKYNTSETSFNSEGLLFTEVLLEQAALEKKINSIGQIIDGGGKATSDFMYRDIVNYVSYMKWRREQ